jgi:hypothetical protein
MHTLRWALLVLALVLALKALLLLVWPARFRALAAWWLAMPRWLARFCGLLTLAGGTLLLGLAVSQIANPAVVAGLLAGATLVCVGGIFQAPTLGRGLVQAASARRPHWLAPAFGIAGLVLATLLAWAAWR